MTSNAQQAANVASAVSANLTRDMPGVVSNEARSMVRDLLDAPIPVRRQVLRDMDSREMSFLFQESRREAGSLYAFWHDTPSGFVEDVCGETIWSKQREVLDALVDHKRVIVPAGFGVGKCVYANDVIPLASGEMVKASALVGREFEVMSWREDGTQTRRRARAQWNATETVYRLTTASGREVIRNGHHPFWTATAEARKKNGRDPYDYERGGTLVRVPVVRGWTGLAQIKPGDLVLVPEKHHAEGVKRVPEHLPALLGYFLGDGGTSSKSQVTFTQKDGPALDDFRALVAQVGGELAPMSTPFHYRVQRANAASPTGVAPYSPVVDLINEWGLRGKTARDKRFPAWAWTLPNDQLATVVGRLFACDAWVYLGQSKSSRNGGHVGISLASEGLIRDVEAAMLRLGIVGAVRARAVKLNGKPFPAWEWSCRDRKSLALMADLIDMPGKNEKLAELVALNAARGTARVRSWQWRNAPAGYRWDEVRSVEALPEPQQTVAIEVDEDHTFVTSMVEHNTHLAGRATAWFVCTKPIGTGLVVTTATRFRQVRNQLWPHIRKVQARAGLPGHCDTVQWKIEDEYGNEVQVAYGFSAPDNDEAAMQGIHAISLLLIVDEAGGISKMVGEGTNNLLTGDARMLAIGNPAMDDPGSWFEDISEEGFSGDEPSTVSIRIATPDSPAITGEPTPQCRECPTGVPAHPLAKHLPDQDWMDRTIRAYGEDHPYVVAKVFAKFPKDAGNKILPTSWVELAREADEPEGRDYQPLCDIGVDGEFDKFMVRRGAWVRLGVDVAADGGDEFAIYRAIGDVIHMRHASSGTVNSNSVTVATKVLDEIMQAQKVADVLGSRAQIRVKIDAIGVGWGVASLLEKWGEMKRHKAKIVRVNVAEKPETDDPGAEMRPFRKRDEMWLSMRSLLQPDPTSGESRIRLRIDEKAAAQLSVPNFSNQAGGLVVVESKKSMRARGRKSPDRAEAALLAVYEPFPITKGRRRGIIGGGA